MSYSTEKFRCMKCDTFHDEFDECTEMVIAPKRPIPEKEYRCVVALGTAACDCGIELLEFYP